MLIRYGIPCVLAAVFLASCAVEQVSLDPDIIEVQVTDDSGPLALVTVSVYDLQDSKNSVLLEEVKTDSQGRAFVTQPGPGSYGIRAYYETGDHTLIAAEELDGDGSGTPIVLVLDSVYGSETKGYICGETMCCSTAPSGCCWPK